MDFQMPNPSAAFNALFQTMAPFLEMARATQARRYALEPHFTRKALEEKQLGLDAMEMAAEEARRDSYRKIQEQRQADLDRKRAQGQEDLARNTANWDNQRSMSAARDLARMQGMPSAFQVGMTGGAYSPWEAMYKRLNGRADSGLWAPGG